MITEHSERTFSRTTELEMVRTWRTGESIVSRLSFEGEDHCLILEGTKTAIPAGRYEIRLTHSPKFGVTMPILCEVPGREGIRIHVGNKAKDTKGCLLPGNTRFADEVRGSKFAYAELFAKLQASLGPRFITIKDAP